MLDFSETLACDVDVHTQWYYNVKFVQNIMDLGLLCLFSH